MPDSELHSLPNGRSRGDLAPARLPDAPGAVPGSPGPLRLPRSATAQRARHQNGPTRLEGKGSCSYSHSLVFVLNEMATPSLHPTGPWEERRGLCRDSEELCRCHRSSAGAQTTLQWVPARDGMPALSSYFTTVLLGIWFFNLFSFAS